MLQAFQMRSLVVLLDGVDEAGNLAGVVESFIFSFLLPSKFRFVITSRPEGLQDLSRYKRDFAIFDLCPLTDDQQREAVTRQVEESHQVCKGNAMFDHLMAFRQIRRSSDEMYPNVFDEPTRTLMQNLKPVDSIKGNPSMRHKCGASQRFISRVAEHTNPHSKTLTSLNDFFTSIQPDSSSSDTLLVKLDRRLGGIAQEMADRGSGGTVPSKERMQNEVASLLDLDGWSSTLDGEELDVLIEKHPNGSQIKVFGKLGLPLEVVIKQLL